MCCHFKFAVEGFVTKNRPSEVVGQFDAARVQTDIPLPQLANLPEDAT